MKTTRKVLGHLLVHLFNHSHCSLICLLRIACFVCFRIPLRSFDYTLSRSRAHGEAVFVYVMSSSISYNLIPQPSLPPPLPWPVRPCCTLSRNGMESTRRVLGHSLIRSLTLLTHFLAPHCSLPSRALLRSFASSLAYLLASLLAYSCAPKLLVRGFCL